MTRAPASISSRRLRRVDLEPDRGGVDDRVEVAAERQVVDDAAQPGHVDDRVARVQEARARCAASPSAPRPPSTATRASTRPGGRVEPDDRLGLGHRHHPGLDQHGRDADRPVPAHRQAAGDLDEQHAPVGVRRASAAAGSRPDIAPCPRGSRISSSRRSSSSASKWSLRSSIVAPGSGPTPPVTTRVGMPSVCESTAAKTRAALKRRPLRRAARRAPRRGSRAPRP